MFDFKRTKIFAVIGTIGLLAVTILTIKFLNLHMFIGLGIFAVLLFIFAIFLQKYSADYYVKLRQRVTDHLEADQFLKEMRFLVNTNKRYSDWQLYKQFDYALALIWTGHLEEAKESIAKTEEDFGFIIPKNLSFRLSVDHINALIDAFTDPEQFSYSMEKVEETFSQLSSEHQRRIKESPRSYYNLLNTIQDIMEGNQTDIDCHFNDYPVLFQVVILHFLANYAKDQEKENQFHERLHQYKGSVFILNQENSNQLL